MAFPIIPKRRSGASGNPTTLNLGELAVNTQTGELFLGADAGVTLLNGPVSAGTTVTERIGDGTTTAFTFAGFNGTGDGGYLVSVGGIDQPPSTYSISNTAGGTITFVQAPVAGELISIRAIVSGSGGGGGTGTVTSITAGTGLDGGTITDSGTISLASITTAQSNVGSSTAIPVLSINDKGQVTALSTTEFSALTTTQIAGLATTAAAALATAGYAGLSTFAARADHQHAYPTAAQIGALGATATAGGDLTGSYPVPTLAAITTAQSNVGSANVVPVLSVDAKGRVTSLTTAAISAGTTTAITSLTGDVTATGPGAVTATLAAITTAQSNVGSSSQIPILSIDEKGRVTALSSTEAVTSGNATQIQGRNVSATAPTASQTLQWNDTTQQWEPYGGSYTVEVLVVAGGGGGGAAGGGGGGGVLISTGAPVVGISYPVTIGAGGAGGTTSSSLGVSGGNSAVFNLTAIGGGGGGAWSTSSTPQNGLSGGSGGGAGLNQAGSTNTGGSGTSGQGNAGGNSNQSYTTGYTAAGGGGANAVGGSKNNNTAGSGGAGIVNAYNGTSLYWGGGGGGGAQQPNSIAGNGGTGGGGGGAQSQGSGTGSAGTGGGSALNTGGNGTTSGTGGAGGANTGGGGGAMGLAIGTAGAGASGIVVVRYLGAQRGSGGTVTSSGGYTIHTFTSSGTFAA